MIMSGTVIEDANVKNKIIIQFRDTLVLNHITDTEIAFMLSDGGLDLYGDIVAVDITRGSSPIGNNRLLKGADVVFTHQDDSYFVRGENAFIVPKMISRRDRAAQGSADKQKEWFIRRGLSGKAPPQNYWISNKDSFIRYIFLLLLNNYLTRLLLRLRKAILHYNPVVNTPRNILYICFHGIGDAIMQTPSLRALKQKFPESRICVLCNARNFEVFKYNPDISEIILYPESKMHRLSFKEITAIFVLRRHRFDLSVLDVSGSTVRGKFISLVIGCKYIIAESHASSELDFLADEVLFPTTRHRVTRNLEVINKSVLRNIPPQQNTTELTLRYSDQDETSVSRLLKERGIEQQDLLVAMHAGCGDSEIGIQKRWSLYRFARLAVRIREKFPNAKILIFKGPQEKSLDYSRLAKKNCIVIQGLSLLESAALIKRCALVISNDSGIGHLAASLKTPVVAIFGPTDPEDVRPFADNVTVIRKNSCPPCHGDKNYLVRCAGSVNCLNRLTVDRVFAAVKDKLDARIISRVVSSSPVGRKAQGTGRNRVVESAIGRALMVRVSHDLLEVWSCYGNCGDKRAEMNQRTDIAIWREVAAKEEIFTDSALGQALEKVISATEKPDHGKLYNSMYWLAKLSVEGEISKEHHQALLSLYENRLRITGEKDELQIKIAKEIEELDAAVDWILSQMPGDSETIRISRDLVIHLAKDIRLELTRDNNNLFTVPYILYKKIEKFRKAIPEGLFTGELDLNDSSNKPFVAMVDGYFVWIEMLVTLRHKRYLSIRGAADNYKRIMQEDEIARLDLALQKIKSRHPEDWFDSCSLEVIDLTKKFIKEKNFQVGFAMWWVVSILKLGTDSRVKECVSEVLWSIDKEFVGEEVPLAGELPVILVIFGSISPTQAKELMQRHNVAGAFSNFGSAISHLSEELNNNGIPGIFGVPLAFLESVDEGEKVALIPRRESKGQLIENTVIRSPSIEEVSFILAGQINKDAQQQYYVRAQNHTERLSNGSQVEVALSADNLYEFQGGRSGKGGINDVGSVKLVRSESHQLWQNANLPYLQELVGIYTEFAEASDGKLIIVRTLDRQPDKRTALYADLPFDDAHTGFNFYRTAEGKELVLLQLQALILVYLNYDNIGVMFPMVSGAEDVEYIFRLIKEIRDALAEKKLLSKGTSLNNFRVNFLLENVSAVDNIQDILETAILLGQEFGVKIGLNIGTNDLTKSVLDIDRDDPSIGEKIEGVTPSVARRIIQVVKEASAKEIPVCICGSFASEPNLWVILVYMAKQFHGLQISIAVPFARVFEARYYFVSQLPEFIKKKRTPKRVKELFDFQQSLPKRQDLNSSTLTFIDAIRKAMENDPRYQEIQSRVAGEALEKFSSTTKSSSPVNKPKRLRNPNQDQIDSFFGSIEICLISNSAAEQKASYIKASGMIESYPVIYLSLIYHYMFEHQRSRRDSLSKLLFIFLPDAIDALSPAVLNLLMKCSVLAESKYQRNNLDETIDKAIKFWPERIDTNIRPVSLNYFKSIKTPEDVIRGFWYFLGEFLATQDPENRLTALIRISEAVEVKPELFLTLLSLYDEQVNPSIKDVYFQGLENTCW
jgi:heptosyltransferase II